MGHFVSTERQCRKECVGREAVSLQHILKVGKLIYLGYATWHVGS